MNLETKEVFEDMLYIINKYKRVNTINNTLTFGLNWLNLFPSFNLLIEILAAFNFDVHLESCSKRWQQLFDEKFIEINAQGKIITEKETLSFALHEFRRSEILVMMSFTKATWIQFN